MYDPARIFVVEHPDGLSYTWVIQTRPVQDFLDRTQEFDRMVRSTHAVSRIGARGDREKQN
jgi:hypothetical protein